MLRSASFAVQNRPHSKIHAIVICRVCGPTETACRTAPWKMFLREQLPSLPASAICQRSARQSTVKRLSEKFVPGSTQRRFLLLSPQKREEFFSGTNPCTNHDGCWKIASTGYQWIYWVRSEQNSVVMPVVRPYLCEHLFIREEQLLMTIMAVKRNMSRTFFSVFASIASATKWTLCIREERSCIWLLTIFWTSGILWKGRKFSKHRQSTNNSMSGFGAYWTNLDSDFPPWRNSSRGRDMRSFEPVVTSKQPSP